MFCGRGNKNWRLFLSGVAGHLEGKIYVNISLLYVYIGYWFNIIIGFPVNTVLTLLAIKIGDPFIFGVRK